MDDSPKKVRTSRARKVVDKSRRANTAQGNVKNLPTTRLELCEVDGRPKLTAIFARKGRGEPDRLDLSFLLEFPGLTHDFAEAVQKWGRAQKQITRLTAMRNLRAGWLAYLIKEGLEGVSLTQLDEQIMSGFKQWLNQQVKSDGQPRHPNSIRQHLGILRIVLRHVSGGGQWLDLVPAGPRGASRKTNAAEVLQFDQLLEVMAAVEKEVLALRDRWEAGRRYVALGRNYLSQGHTLFHQPNSNEARTDSNLAVALAMIDMRYSGVIPDSDVILQDHPLLGATIKYAVRSKAAGGYFYASGRDLVPLAVSLALATALNPETVLMLCWKHIDRNVDRVSDGRPAVQFKVRDKEGEEENSELGLGTPLTKVTGDKPRARRQLVRLLDPASSGPNQVSLNLVLDLLGEMTARIRPIVIDPELYGDRVFLFVQKSCQKRPKGFGDSSQLASADLIWQTALRRFIADNKLPPFTLKTIRATLLDYTQLFNRGNLDAARQLGDHGSRLTTWTHYTSHLVKRLLHEATGETLLVRERWLQSDGKLDPRAYRDWTDKGCATPGWTCLDPFDSPRQNQKVGRLCTAYGECPDCPHAAARPENPRNVMLYEALRRAIYRSVTCVTASVWRARWAPVVAALDGLLALVSTQVIAESRKLTVELPDIG